MKNMTTLKIQYIDYESGEFINKQSVDYDSFINIFRHEANDKQYSKYSWTIGHIKIKYYLSTDVTYFLLIEHNAKNGYRVTFCSKDDKCCLSNNFYSNSIDELCKEFFDKNFSILKSKLGFSEEGYHGVVKSFKEIKFTYSLKYPAIFLLSFIFYVGWWLLTILFLIVHFYIPFAIFATGLIILMGYHVRLHYRYYVESKNKTITISSGHEEIKITIGDAEYNFLKSDILNVKFVGYGGRHPYAPYEYTQLELRDGSIVNISSMLISTFKMEDKMKNVKHENVHAGYAYIKPKTNFATEEFKLVQ